MFTPTRCSVALQLKKNNNPESTLEKISPCFYSAMLSSSWNNLAPFLTHRAIPSWLHHGPASISCSQHPVFFQPIHGVCAHEAFNSLRLRRILTHMSRLWGKDSGIPDKARHFLPPPMLCCKNEQHSGWLKPGWHRCLWCPKQWNPKR